MVTRQTLSYSGADMVPALGVMKTCLQTSRGYTLRIQWNMLILVENFINCRSCSKYTFSNLAADPKTAPNYGTLPKNEAEHEEHWQNGIIDK